MALVVVIWYHNVRITYSGATIHKHDDKIGMNTISYEQGLYNISSNGRSEIKPPGAGICQERKPLLKMQNLTPTEVLIVVI